MGVKPSETLELRNPLSLFVLWTNCHCRPAIFFFCRILTLLQYTRLLSICIELVHLESNHTSQEKLGYTSYRHLHNLFCLLFPWSLCSSLGVGAWLHVGRPWDCSISGESKRFLISRTSVPALGTTLPCTRWMPGSLCLG